MFRVACNCEISNGGSHKATLIVQSSGQSRHPEITGWSQMRINVADSFHRIENASVWCNKAFNGTRKRGWSGQAIIVPRWPINKRYSRESWQIRKVSYISWDPWLYRVNKTLTLQVQFRSRKSFFRKKDNSRIIPRSIVGPRKFERFLSEITSINSLFVQLEDIAKNKK